MKSEHRNCGGKKGKGREKERRRKKKRENDLSSATWRKDLHESPDTPRGHSPARCNGEATFAHRRQTSRERTSSRTGRLAIPPRAQRAGRRCFCEVDLTRHRHSVIAETIPPHTHTHQRAINHFVCSNVESASITTRCLARRCRPARCDRQIDSRVASDFDE